MDIIYLGHSSFKISGKNASVVTDPYAPDLVGMKFPKVDATIVTISHDHQDHNDTTNVGNVKKIISGPGEYEIEGISVIGISTYHDDKEGKERGKNVVFVFEIDGFRLAHLGDLGHKLTEDQLENIGEIDVLMIPVGGVYTIDSNQAYEVARQIEPKIIIPMHYKHNELKGGDFQSLEGVEEFVKLIGLQAQELPKLSLKEGMLPEEQQQLIILTKR